MTDFLKTKFKFNLQQFAEDGENSQDQAAESADNDSDNTEKGQDQPFKTFQTEKEFNSFLDSTVDKRLEKALSKARQKWESEGAEKKKISDMTAEEKAAYKLQKQTEALQAKEKELTIRENKANVITKLGEDGLPTELAGLFKLESTETLKDQYKSMSTVFRNAVDKQTQINLAKSSGAPGAGAEGKAVESEGSKMAKDANNEKERAKKLSESFWK
ncbi:hypothetical protein lacNasYZ03_11650 [Lactobacillus nasalidis]|uniref:DUF4355 domain-containing protein n=1 Tax=Lactobacillus nasalidis TaxID=2797258 RepID=A0ABQ3W4M0_9LACO|nr:DUF4355 domain-containing protein [Lactobacillus nasalidis]GHV97889.1 hypothetical protein lacNasYZ01_10710 [Lactobacillus nasalidis]GHW00119.1 hypothetical protein lacNasYZ02_15480 [Lactobacillus nasalidis]GHW01478.1 hypothetical protein lacNasYZ03_11650 [Lactobacillus nasalidis]